MMIDHPHIYPGYANAKMMWQAAGDTDTAGYQTHYQGQDTLPESDLLVFDDLCLQKQSVFLDYLLPQPPTPMQNR